MSFSFLPKIIARDLPQITEKILLERGIRLLMLDFDNTIVPYTTNEPSEKIKKWLTEMRNSPIKLCVVSNSKRSRVRDFCAEYGLDCITRAKKPFSRGIDACLAKYGIPPQEAALVGDQIFTDTLGANGVGVTSVLVKAIDNHNVWLKLRHVAELPFIFAAKKRRI